ncbi:MAG: hypothetical protein U0359_35205 [Byssovorax sp.]
MITVPRITSWLLGALLLGACSAAGKGSGFTGTGGQGGETASGTTSGPSTTSGGTGGDPGVGGFGFGGSGGTNQGGAPPTCAEETQFVYTLAANNGLYKFDPPTTEFTYVGTLDCPSDFNSPFSMAVDRDGQAWVVFTDGSLYKVDTKNGHCTATSFQPGQHGFTTFGMGFSSNGVGTTDETLYVSESSFGGATLGLATIDLKTMTLTPIGGYDKLQARAEMTGTGDAKLYGAFEGSPYIVAQVDKSNAHILDQAPQSAINYPPGSSNFAFAFWGGDFWLFVGPGTSTDVFHYKPSTGMTSFVKTVNMVIVGAGVSTCAPFKPPS